MKHCCAALAVAAIALTSTGCWFGTGSTSDIRYEVTDQTGIVLEPEFGIKLGRLTTAMAKPFARKASGESVPLKGIAKIEVGIYNVVDAYDPVESGMADLDFPGWEPIARIRDGDERIQVLCKIEGERIRAMMVLVLDGDELVVVRLKGNLHKFLPAALEHAGWGGIRGSLDANDQG
jgi:hypothetical protein